MQRMTRSQSRQTKQDPKPTKEECIESILSHLNMKRFSDNHDALPLIATAAARMKKNTFKIIVNPQSSKLYMDCAQLSNYTDRVKNGNFFEIQCNDDGSLQIIAPNHRGMFLMNQLGDQFFGDSRYIFKNTEEGGPDDSNDLFNVYFNNNHILKTDESLINSVLVPIMKAIADIVFKYDFLYDVLYKTFTHSTENSLRAIPVTANRAMPFGFELSLNHSNGEYLRFYFVYGPFETIACILPSEKIDSRRLSNCIGLTQPHSDQCKGLLISIFDSDFREWIRRERWYALFKFACAADANAILNAVHLITSATAFL